MGSYIYYLCVYKKSSNCPEFVGQYFIIIMLCLIVVYINYFMLHVGICLLHCDVHSFFFVRLCNAVSAHKPSFQIQYLIQFQQENNILIYTAIRTHVHMLLLCNYTTRKKNSTCMYVQHA